MKLSGILWEEVARLYRKHRPGPPGSWYRILDGLGLRARGQHVVDLGTGPGPIALEFARRGAHVTGVDKSAGQIAQARLRRPGKQQRNWAWK